MKVKAVMNYNQESHRGEQAGFTLLETSIAMVLLAIVGLGIASCFFFAMKNNDSARERELSMAVAQQQMEQYRNLRFNDAGLAANGGTSVVITRAGRRYQVLTTITDSNLQNNTARTKAIQIRVIHLSDNSTWARNIATYFGSVTIVSQRTSQSVGPNRAL
jgi:prepilin-type N-terminal cleavage/methylation domain-containing protein